MDSLAYLDSFIEKIDNGTLFHCRDADHFTDLRITLRKVLIDLLFHRRPEVERKRGIDTVYAHFRQNISFFTSFIQPETQCTPPTANTSIDPFISKQAELFLAFLPFPGQWEWLNHVTTKYPDNGEVQLFLKNETDRIQRKLEKKRHKTFHFKDFCQILKPPTPLLKSPPTPLPVEKEVPMDKGIVMEKGVLRIFSIPYLFFLVPDLLKQISRHYVLYVEPAAGINFRHEWLRVYATLEDPVLFGLSSSEDRHFIDSQQGTLTTHLAHGDYLEPFPLAPHQNLSSPHKVSPSHKISPSHHPEEGEEKNYDIIFNNTFDERDRKRHTLMLDLMHHPLLDKTTALFIGRGSKKNVMEFKQEIKQKGLEGRTQVAANIKRKEVPAFLAQCRIGVHLALQENGCRAVYEYLRSDLPCVISTATAGMNLQIITPETGMAVEDDALPEAIAETLQRQKRGPRFHPSAWFAANSGSAHSTRALNEVLTSLFQTLGYPWQNDIVPLTSSGLGRYADKRDYQSLKPHFKALFRLFSNEKRLPIRLSDPSISN